MKKFSLVLGFMLMMLLAFSTSLMAANQIVTSTANSGAGTLRQAIADVSDGGTITFNITGSDEIIIESELSIITNTKGMTINGYNNATGNNVTVQVPIQGWVDPSRFRVFNINATSQTFNFSNMTIKGGDIYGNTYWSGGGIFLEAGTLSLDTVTISGSIAKYGGGIYNAGTLTMTNCTVSGNYSFTSGAGIFNGATLTMTNCTVSGNYSSQRGGGIYKGQAILTMTNCTVSGNLAGWEFNAYEGGGLYAAYSHGNPLFITNCTFANNSAPNAHGGGIYLTGSSSTTHLYIKNTIIANNSAEEDYTPDFYIDDGTVYNNGYNIVETQNGSDFVNGTNGCIVGVGDYNLSTTLNDNSTLNGTKTLRTTDGSVAIDAGTNVQGDHPVAIPTTDQRGAGRNGTLDIGAYEWWDNVGSLSVVLSTFTAQFIENTPTLYWETQSETDNMGWFVYRNSEEDFTTSEKISEFINGHGTTTQQQSYIYEDRIQNPEVGDTYYYWLESIDYSGTVNHYDRVAILTIPHNSNSGNNLVPVPERFGLLQNEPNPVIHFTRIAFNLTESAMVDLNVYNIKGQLVKTLYSGVTSKHTVMWDGKDESGKELENGVYFYNMIVDGKVAETKKLILMK